MTPYEYEMRQNDKKAKKEREQKEREAKNMRELKKMQSSNPNPMSISASKMPSKHQFLYPPPQLHLNNDHYNAAQLPPNQHYNIFVPPNPINQYNNNDNAKNFDNNNFENKNANFKNGEFWICPNCGEKIALLFIEHHERVCLIKV